MYKDPTPSIGGVRVAQPERNGSHSFGTTLAVGGERNPRNNERRVIKAKRR